MEARLQVCARNVLRAVIGHMSVKIVQLIYIGQVGQHRSRILSLHPSTSLMEVALKKLREKVAEVLSSTMETGKDQRSEGHQAVVQIRLPAVIPTHQLTRCTNNY